MLTIDKGIGRAVLLLGLISAASPVLSSRSLAQRTDTLSEGGKGRGGYHNPYIEAGKRGSEPRVTLTVSDSTIEYIITQIGSLTGLGVTYPHSYEVLSNRISVSFVNMRVTEALAHVLRETDLVAELPPGQTIITLIERVRPVYVRETEVIALDDEAERPPPQKFELDSTPRHRSLDRQLTAELTGVVTTASGIQRESEVGAKIATIFADSVADIFPVRQVSSLLQGRVPGMVVQSSSGSPGDPSRIRIRSYGSIAAYNDPIIVVDGIRMYSRQSDPRNANIGGYVDVTTNKFSQFSSPSPLDQIEPSIIEKIEILKGPSASALYGSDASNGVIVISTKKGRAGDTEWRVMAQQGVDMMPNDPYPSDLSPFARGTSTALSATVAGGNNTIQYAYTMGRRLQMGVLKLPEYEQGRYRSEFGMETPGWMKRPDRFGGWGGNGQVNIQVNSRFHLSLSNLMNFQNQERSSMTNLFGGALAEMRERFLNGIWSPGDTLISHYYGKVSSETHNMMMSFQAMYNPIEWIPIIANFGLARLMKKDAHLVSSGFHLTSDSSGFYGGGEGTAIERSFGLYSNIPLYESFSVAVGMNAHNGKVSDMKGAFNNIPLGVTTPSSGDVLELVTPENSWRLIGFFLEPKFSIRDQLYITPGLRVDNAALSGQKAIYRSFPKLSASWIVSENASFDKYSDKIQSLRLRAAMGTGGVPPTSADYIDRYRSRMPGVANQNFMASALNDRSMPRERSVEIEGGLDAEIYNGRLAFDITYFWKKRQNALILSALGSSLPKYNSLQKTGDLQFGGIEFGMDAELYNTPGLTWNQSLTLVRGTNKLVKLEQLPKSLFDADPNEGYEMESKSPNLQGSTISHFRFLEGWVGVTAALTYSGGIYQRPLIRETGTPSGSQWSSQTSRYGFRYGPTQTVHSLRLHSMSVNARVPDMLVRLMRARNAEISLQGTNLWLSTNYANGDPDLTGLSIGNATVDSGQVPVPRSFLIRALIGW